MGVSRFLEHGTIVFGDIRQLLDQQFNRFASFRKAGDVLFGDELEWVTLPKLLENIGMSPMENCWKR